MGVTAISNQPASNATEENFHIETLPHVKAIDPMRSHAYITHQPSKQSRRDHRETALVPVSTSAGMSTPQPNASDGRGTASSLPAHASSATEKARLVTGGQIPHPINHILHHDAARARAVGCMCDPL